MATKSKAQLTEERFLALEAKLAQSKADLAKATSVFQQQTGKKIVNGIMELEVNDPVEGKVKYTYELAVPTPHNIPFESPDTGWHERLTMPAETFLLLATGNALPQEYFTRQSSVLLGADLKVNDTFKAALARMLVAQRKIQLAGHETTYFKVLSVEPVSK